MGIQGALFQRSLFRIYSPRMRIGTTRTVFNSSQSYQTVPVFLIFIEQIPFGVIPLRCEKERRKQDRGEIAKRLIIAPIRCNLVFQTVHIPRDVTQPDVDLRAGKRPLRGRKCSQRIGVPCFDRCTVGG